MNDALELLSGPLARRMGWVLLHSLWQGALVGGFFALARFALRRGSADLRYLAGCLALAVLLLGPVLTFFVATPLAAPAAGDIGGTGLPSTAAPSGGFASGVAESHSWLQQTAGTLAWVAPWLTTAWLLGVLFFAFKLTRGWWEVGKIRTREIEPVESGWLDRLDELRRRLEISRPVRLLKSGLVEVPTVIGWLRPVILLPAASLTGLTPTQLEAILAHELAHVRRFDYLVNGCQCAIETLLFYHPVVWWISRCVREERENCCDDLVIKVCGDRVSYARALAALEMFRADGPELAMAASGGSLLKRIQRLLGIHPDDQPAGLREFSGLALLGTGLVLIALGVCLNFMPTTYAAVTRILVQRGGPARFESNGGQFQAGDDPYFIQTQFELIRSETVLRQAVESLSGNAEWGKKFAGGNPLQTAAAIEALKQRFELRAVRNTSVVEIHAFGDTAEEAAAIANQVADSYRIFRLNQRQALALSDLQTLKEQLAEQDQKMAYAQDHVDKLRKELSITESAGPLDEVRNIDTQRRPEFLRIEAEAQLARSEMLLKYLKSMSREELRKALPTAIQDNQLNGLVTELDLAEQSFIKVKSDMGSEHVEYKKTVELVNDLNRKINERIDGILAGLGAQAESQKSYTESVRKEIEDAKQRDIETAERSAPYFEAKRKLEELKRFSQILNTKIMSETVETSLPAHGLVDVIDRAMPSLRPVSPDHRRATGFIGFGVVLDAMGLLLLKARPHREVVLHPA